MIILKKLFIRLFTRTARIWLVLITWVSTMNVFSFLLILSPRVFFKMTTVFIIALTAGWDSAENNL